MAHVIWKSHQGTEKRRGLKRAEHSIKTTTKPAQARAELKNQQRKNEVLAGIELNMAGIRRVRLWAPVPTQHGYTETCRLRLVGLPVH